MIEGSNSPGASRQFQLKKFWIRPSPNFVSGSQAKFGLVLSKVRTPAPGVGRKKKKKVGVQLSPEYGLVGYVELGF